MILVSAVSSWSLKHSRNLLLFLLLIISVTLLAYNFVSEAEEGEDIIISSNTSWPAGAYTYRDITITNNAVLTLQGSYTNDDDGIGVTINARNITVEAGSSINANAQGYGYGAGPGKGYLSGSNYGSGGAHGGNGAAAAVPSSSVENTLIYDTTFRPTLLGSGGGRSTGGTGGGSIIVNTSSSIIVDGSISANGGNASTNGGGGSGGTVSISASSISGAGSISAIGGNGPGNSGSGGGGGRISLYYSDLYSLNSSNISVAGGTGFGTRIGDDGTVIIFDTSNKDLQVEHDLILRKIEGLDQDGQPTADGNYHFRNLTIGNNAVLFPQSTYTDNTDGAGIKLYLSGDLTIDTGSKIDAKGAGYVYNSGPGTGTGTGLLGGGAGHGGAGGNGDSGTGGTSYGDTLLPLTLGSGGHAPGGGYGGGAVYFEIDGIIAVNGDIDASGNDAVASGSNRGSGGSGGSIFIKSESISGSGNILANGGAGLQYSGGGSGGRIALYSDITSFSPNQISANGGAGGGGGASQPGETGTIFIYDVATRNVTASNDVTFEATQGLNPDGSFRNDGVYYFNDFTVSNGATVTIGSYYTDENDGRGVTLNISGDLDVESGSKISADEQGFVGAVGPGKGSGDFYQSGGGGSYGGLGGPSYNASPGLIYGEDSSSFPHMLGSGGGIGAGGAGGRGGGAITLRVLGDVTVSGEISVDGGIGNGRFSDWRPGGGSGGSIFIVCDSISGSGSITADGGNGLFSRGFFSGAGGGGRISIVYQTGMSLSPENITTSGGNCDDPGGRGSEGTINIEQISLPSNVFSLRNPNNGSSEFTNTEQVEIVPEEDRVKEFKKANSPDDLAPAIYDSNWSSINMGTTLSGEEGEKTVITWLKDNKGLISENLGISQIVLDKTQPELELEHESTTPTNQNIVTITGRAYDELSGVDYIEINGEKYSIDGNLVAYNHTRDTLNIFRKALAFDGEIFNIPTVLNVGENIINISVVDLAGNIVSRSLKFIYSQSTTIDQNNQSATPDYEADSIVVEKPDDKSNKTTSNAPKSDKSENSISGSQFSESKEDDLESKNNDWDGDRDKYRFKEFYYLYLLLLLLFISIMVIAIIRKKRN